MATDEHWQMLNKQLRQAGLSKPAVTVLIKELKRIEESRADQG